MTTILLLLVAAFLAGFVAVIGGAAFADGGNTTFQVALAIFQQVIKQPLVLPIRPVQEAVIALLVFIKESILHSEANFIVVGIIVAIIIFIISRKG